MFRDAESELLEKQCREVAKTWEEFKKHFPNLSLLEGVSHLPTVESLQHEVSAAQSKWAAKKEKGFGKAKDHAMSFLETLEGHKALFSVFPSGDKYTSLFTGVISTVVKVCIIPFFFPFFLFLSFLLKAIHSYLFIGFSQLRTHCGRVFTCISQHERRLELRPRQYNYFK